MIKRGYWPPHSPHSPPPPHCTPVGHFDEAVKPRGHDVARRYEVAAGSSEGLRDAQQFEIRKAAYKERRTRNYCADNVVSIRTRPSRINNPLDIGLVWASARR